MSTVTASCLCEAVCVEATLPEKWCANCHCSMCRRAHGAPWVTWVGFDKSAVRLVRGHEVLRERASSPAAHRSFCSNCGTPMLFRSTRWPDEIHVARACFPDDAPLRVQAHAFFSDRAPWHPVDDDLPRRGGPSGSDPL